MDPKQAYSLPLRESRATRAVLIGGTLLLLGSCLLLPLAAVFIEAFRRGFGMWLNALQEAEALHAVTLTLLVAAICLPVNLAFGIAASWAITKHRFPFKSLLLTIIDLPFATSPVVSGFMFILLFGVNGWFGSLVESIGWQIVFAVPGIVLVTIFVTFPFIARELIPAMQAEGNDEEEAAWILGANGWQILTRVTLPKVKWALFYGLLLSNARAMGEFGAVSVVSGHIRGLTNTVPLHVEVLYNEYNFVAAFAMASLLALLALITLGARSTLEWQAHRRAMIEKSRVPNRPPLGQPISS